MHKISQFIKSGLREHAERVQTLTAALHQSIPAEFQGHCAVIGASQASLNLIADSAAIATRLRYLSPVILRYFGDQLGQNYQKLAIRVHPLQAARDAPAPPCAAPNLPQTTAEALNRLAEGCPDPDLAASLKRLAGKAARPV